MDRSLLSSLSTSSGVYIFKNRHGDIIYIGKATCLKKRVRSYFKKNSPDFKIKILQQEIADISTIETKTEIEASILEAQLISKHQPRYNVLLKGGQPFVYLVFTNEMLPKFIITRTKPKKGTSFGPFLQKTDARRVHDYLTKTFRLALCNKKMKEGCLNYHLDLCAGSCKDNFDNADYGVRINLAKQVLRGKKRPFLKQVLEQVHLYNEQLEFERARNLYQYIEHMEKIFAALHAKFHDAKYATAVQQALQPHMLNFKHKQGAKKLQELLHLKHLPRTIDCFDISHFQSQALVGSCVRFTDGVPDKKMFRRFRIKTLTQQNDCAALQEIVKRRYKNKSALPHLIVIDGGKGQLHSVEPLVPDIPCIGIAKKEERLFSKHFSNGFLLDIKTDVGQLIIALRDYAHHFAVKYHRVRRSKDFFEQRKT